MSIGFDEVGGIVRLLRATARAEVLPRFQRLQADDIRRKAENDYVTDADEAAEAAITTALRSMFPGCLVVGEEATARDPGLLGKLAEAPLAFTVDPIDGTANFIMGVAAFGMMVAAVAHGAVIGAVILDPVCDSWSVAVAGQGAWLERPDGARRRLRVAAPVPLARMTGVASWRYFQEPIRSKVACNLARVGHSWDFRCASQQYRALAAGHCHFLLFNRLMPWDHLPGVLLHREAGGYSARLDGSAYQPGEVAGGLICAPDEASWKILRSALWD